MHGSNPLKTIVELESLGSAKISGVRRYFIRCQCHCGKEFTARSDHLKRSAIKSCGCTRYKKNRLAHNAKPVGYAAARTVWNSYRQKCSLRGIRFELSVDRFKYLCEQDCYYCGAAPSAEYKEHFLSGPRIGMRKLNGTFRYSGLDQIVANAGYFEGNIRPCCARCNFAKHTGSEREFRAWAERLAAHLPNWTVSNGLHGIESTSDA
jgi:hypothetical protein